ncbi:hypothetical protein CPB83DRAFT_886572 [Crepidotus variabilis]|uniref:Uncharacterized protein n=1 Tax=Crepidotus variabilis TaxID=179855 RepID=A0A9P6JK62_9AGAR|nr:hypothetical protein CPB83DRAFT_886572 [Crepidotus variabilis]
MTSKVVTQERPVPTAGQGFADIVGFGLNGVVILRNSYDLRAMTVIRNFGYNAGGWRNETHVRLIADMTGKKRSDVVGFGDNGVSICFNDGNNTFGPQKLVVPDFAFSVGGWSNDKHLRYVADLRNTGRCDIIGFGDGGVVVSQNNGNGHFDPPKLALPDLGYNAGNWRLDRHLRFLADVTGDGLPDIVAFGDEHVFICRNQGNGTFAPVQPVLNDLCANAGGWRIADHPRCVADLTGDGKADIIGFGDAGVLVSWNDGNGNFGPANKVIDSFGTAQAWRVDKHPRYVADLTGKKRGDIVGFGDAGVRVSYNNGDGTFQPEKLVLANFGVDQGWSLPQHQRFLADMTGDGCADIIGFGGEAVYVSFNDGKGGFSPVKRITSEFTSTDAWAWDKTPVVWYCSLCPIPLADPSIPLHLMGNKKKVKSDKKSESNLVDDAMAGVHLILGVANGAPGIGVVPFLQPAAQTTLSIIQAIERVKDNKADLKQIVKDAEALILVIYNAYETAEDKKAWPGKGLERSLESLISTLQKVERLAKRRAKRGVIGRFFTSIVDTKKIKDYRHDMDQAQDQFTVSSQLKANELLLRIEGHLEAAVHIDQQTEQAKKEEVEEKQANLNQIEEAKKEADATAKQETQKLETQIDVNQEKLRREAQLAKEREDEIKRAQKELEEAKAEEKRATEQREADEKYEAQLRELRERRDMVRRRQEEDAQRARNEDYRRRQEEESRRVSQRPSVNPSGASHQSGVSFFNGANGVTISGAPSFTVNQGR